MILRFGALQKANGRSSQYGAAKMREARSCRTHHDFQTLGSVLESGQFAAGKYVSRANLAPACLSGNRIGLRGVFQAESIADARAPSRKSTIGLKKGATGSSRGKRIGGGRDCRRFPSLGIRSEAVVSDGAGQYRSEIRRSGEFRIRLS